MKLPTPPSQKTPEKLIPRQTPGWQTLTASAIQVWLVLGLTGLGAGISWRLTGIGPSIFDLFDGLGFAYWLVPLLLISGWDKMRDRQTLHISQGSWFYGLATANAFKMLQYLLLISLAPLGLFLPFSQVNPAAQIRTDLFDLQVGYPEFVLVTLLLSGTVVLCYSLGTLIGTRRIFGSGTGAVIWVMIGAALNSHALTGARFWPVNLSFAGLAEYTRSALNSGFVDSAQVGYVTDAVKLAYGILLVVLLLGVGLLILLQARNNRPRKKLDIYILPAIMGMLLPASYAYAHTSEWVTDPALAYPLPWTSLFMAGIIPLLTVYTLSAWQQDHPRSIKVNLQGFLLLWLCPLAWIAFALPAVNAGQVGKLQLLFAGFVSMVLILLWVVVTNYLVSIRPANPVGRSVILAALLSILVVPLTGSQYPGVALLLIDSSVAFEGQQLLIAAWTSGLVVTSLGIAVWISGRWVRASGKKRRSNPEL